MKDEKNNSGENKRDNLNLMQKVILISLSLILIIFLDLFVRLFFPVSKPIALYQVDNSAEIYFEDFSLGWKLIPQLEFKAKYNFFPTPKFPFAMRRYSIKTNSLGLRDIEINMDENKKRIICLGDSITFGWGVDQFLTYPVHLEWMLNSMNNGQFEVINAGVPGYTSRQGLVFFTKKLLKLKPAYVIISFGANDSTSAPVSDKQSIRYKSISATLHNLFSFSRIYTLMRGSMLPLKKTLHRYNEPGRNIDVVNRVSPDDYYKNILEIVEVAQKNGCKPILLVTTEEDEYSSKMFMVASEKRILLVKGYLSILAHKREIMTDKRFINLRKTYINLLGEPNLMAHPDYFLFVDPVHPSAIGHKIMAEKIFEKLQLLESGN